MNDMLILLAVGVGTFALTLRILNSRRKLNFDRAVLAAKSAPLVLDRAWTPPQSFPPTTVRLDNGSLSVIYAKEQTPERDVVELIDMTSIATFGTGGLNVSFHNGTPTRWGRFGDGLNLPGISPADAQKAKSILEAVRNAIES